MEVGINVRIVSSKDLLEYDKLRRESNATWDDINWEENALESGTGSPDCETHLKITNMHAAWRELFEVQRREVQVLNNSSCDVHIHAREGYIPCHRAFLQNKSELLDRLIVENLKVNMPGNNNVISITLMDVSLDNLKSVMTLLYTGACVVADNNEEDEVKEVLRQLQIDVKKFGLTREPIDPNTLKSKKKKWKTVKSLRYQNADEDIPPTLRPVLAPTVGVPGLPVQPIHVSYSAVVAGPSTSRQVPGTSVSTSLEGLASQPVFAKVPPGSLTQKKPKERIQRNPDERTSTTPNTSIPGNEDVSDGDERQLPLPEVQKVPPGSLIPKNKQPRIIRSLRGRGIRRADSSRTLISGNDAGTTTDQEEEEEEESHTPKGRYEHDSDFVPSGQEEVAGDDVNKDVEKRAAPNLESADGARKPRTRKNASIIQPVEESNSRYPKRSRRRNPSYLNDDTKEKKSDKKKNSDTVQPSVENIPDGPDRARVRGKGVSPVGKGGSNRNLTNDEDIDENSWNRCTFCGDTYRRIEDLKSHLENKCARHFTGTYDLLKKYCETCKSFFKDLYTVTEFMDHVRVCACNARPSQKRQRNSSATGNTIFALPPVKAPTVPPVKQGSEQSTQQKQSKQIGVRENDETNIKSNVQEIHKKSLDILGMTKISVFIDKLKDDQIAKVIDMVHRRESICVSRPKVLPKGQRYVFEVKKDGTVPTSIKTTRSAAPSSVTQRLRAQGASEITNETIPSSSSTPFSPAYASTQLITAEGTNSTKTNMNKVKRTGTVTRPISAPLCVKRRAAAAANIEKEDERKGGQQDNGTKKSHPTIDVQKENNVPQDKSTATLKSTNKDGTLEGQNVQVVTTASSLREKMKKTLRPPQKAATVKENSSRETTSTKINIGHGSSSLKDSITSAKTSSDLEKQPQPSSGEAVGLSNNVVTATEAGLGDRIEQVNQTKTHVGNVETRVLPVVQKQRQQTVPTTVSSLLNSAIDDILQNSEAPTKLPTTTSIVPVLTDQSITLSENSQLKQGNSSALATSSKTSASSIQVDAEIPLAVQIQLAKTGHTATSSQVNAQKTIPITPASAPYLLAAQQQQNRSLPSQPLTVAAAYKTLTNKPNIQRVEKQQQIHLMQQQQQSTFPNLPVGVQQLTSECTVRTVTTSQGPLFRGSQQSQQQITRPQTIDPVSKTASNQPRVVTPRQVTQGFQNVDIRRIETSMTFNPSSHNNNPSQSSVTHQQHQSYTQQGMLTTQQYQQHSLGTIPVSNALPYSQNSGSSSASGFQERLTQVPDRPASVFPQVIAQQQQPTRPQSALTTVQQQQSTNTVHGGLYSSVFAQQQQFHRTPFSAMTGQMMQSSNMQQHQSNQLAIMPAPQQMPNMASSSQSRSTPGSTVYSQSSNLPTVPTIILGSTTDTTLVHLPLSAQMNPLANNRSIQMTAQQNQRQSDMFGNEAPPIIPIQTHGHAPLNTFSSTIQNITGQVAAATSSSAATGPSGKIFLDEEEDGTYKCPDCGLRFKSQERVLEHQNEGMCG